MVIPLTMKREPSVIIKEGRPLLTTNKPFKYPINKTTARVIKAEKGILIPATTVKRVTDILESPIIEPIDKSNSPLIIRSATPIARIPISEDTWR